MQQIVSNPMVYKIFMGFRNCSCFKFVVVVVEGLVCASMFVFVAIKMFPVNIANHSGRTDKYLRHYLLFLGSAVIY